MGIDLHELMRQRDLLGPHSVAHEALKELSRNPSYRWAMEGAMSSPITEAARPANLSAIDQVFAPVADEHFLQQEKTTIQRFIFSHTFEERRP